MMQQFFLSEHGVSVHEPVELAITQAETHWFVKVKVDFKDKDTYEFPTQAEANAFYYGWKRGYLTNKKQSYENTKN